MPPKTANVNLRELLFTPTLPAAPEQKTYTPGVDYETGRVETPETIGIKTFLDQLASRSYENLIRPMSSPVGAGMMALNAVAPGAAAPLNRLLAAVMLPQMVGQGAKDIKQGEYADATMSLAFALPLALGMPKMLKGEPGAVPFNNRPAGSQHTPPSRTYNEGSVKAANVWIRQSDSASNADRTLLVQFSNDLINPKGSGPKSRADAYYDKLYESRSGYDRPADFWEIPQWQANIAHSLPNADVYVIRDPAQAVAFANKAGYKTVAFSALDVNKGLIADFAKQYKGDIAVGGYGELKGAFKDLPNVKVYEGVPAFVADQGGKYTPGYDYRHYHGTKTIPRLTMSDGCLHQCAFCSVPKKVVERSRAEIIQQAEAFAKDLPSSLVYINDKTFGQAKNHTILPEINAMLKKANPEFQGFVVQTTTAQMKKMDPQFMKDAGIKYAELGIETFNDPILRSLKKPSSEALADSAALKLREAGVTMIPNIMVGLPGENPATYARTMNWLQSNSDNISHANIYNLAVYDEAPISKTLKTVSEADKNENVIAKSWMDDPAAHTNFNDQVTDWASGQLDKTPAPVKNSFTTVGGGAGMPTELQTPSPQLNQLLNPPQQGVPQKTIKAFKLFRQDEQGRLFPMFIGAKKEVPVGQWLPAESIPTAGFAERPGWHASEFPSATQIGSKVPGAPRSAPPAFRRPNEVWAEVELPADVDWQSKANQLGTNAKGEIVPIKAHLGGEIPVGGHYNFKTNPNAKGNWYIGGALKVNRILSDAEVEAINKQTGVADLPRREPRAPVLGDLLEAPATPPAAAPKSKLDVAKLGQVIEPEKLEYGFILPDGRAISIKGISGGSHGPRFMEAIGEKPTADWNQEASEWRRLANQEGVIRINSSAMGPAAELYTPPTPAQMRTLQYMEKANGRPLSWDLADPFTARPGGLNVVDTGVGIKYIEGGIFNKKYNPKPPEPKKTSELFTQPLVPLNELLQGGQYGIAV